LAYNLSGTTADYAYDVTTSAAQCCQHLLVPPQTAQSLVLTYTPRNSLISFDYPIRLPRTVWKAGYKYTYALKFTPTEIIADPSVSAWDSDITEVNF